jgi:hypothetical protein
MKLSAAVVLLLATSTSAFSPVSVPKSINTQLQAHNDNLLAKAAATACMTAFLWGSPTVMVEKMECNNMMVVPPAVIEQTMASAVEKASGSGSRVNKDADSLLRYALPIKNKEVRTRTPLPLDGKKSNSNSGRQSISLLDCIWHSLVPSDNNSNSDSLKMYLISAFGLHLFLINLLSVNLHSFHLKSTYRMLKCIGSQIARKS